MGHALPHIIRARFWPTAHRIRKFVGLTHPFAPLDLEREISANIGKNIVQNNYGYRQKQRGLPLQRQYLRTAILEVVRHARSMPVVGLLARSFLKLDKIKIVHVDFVFGRH